MIQMWMVEQLKGLRLPHHYDGDDEHGSCPLSFAEQGLAHSHPVVTGSMTVELAGCWCQAGDHNDKVDRLTAAVTNWQPPNEAEDKLVQLFDMMGVQFVDVTGEETS